MNSGYYAPWRIDLAHYYRVRTTKIDGERPKSMTDYNKSRVCVFLPRMQKFTQTCRRLVCSMHVSVELSNI